MRLHQSRLRPALHPHRTRVRRQKRAQQTLLRMKNHLLHARRPVRQAVRRPMQQA